MKILLKNYIAWKYENNTVKCFGWFDGDAGFENKHELPPNVIQIFRRRFKTKLLFGDLFIVLFDSKQKIKHLSVSMITVVFMSL